MQTGRSLSEPYGIIVQSYSSHDKRHQPTKANKVSQRRLRGQARKKRKAWSRDRFRGRARKKHHGNGQRNSRAKGQKRGRATGSGTSRANVPKRHGSPSSAAHTAESDMCPNAPKGTTQKQMMACADSKIGKAASKSACTGMWRTSSWCRSKDMRQTKFK